MTSLVLNAETSKWPIGDVLASATAPVIEIKDEQGRLIAKIVLNTEVQLTDDSSLVEQAEGDIAELRRRRKMDRSGDVTTRELLARAQNLTSE